MNISQFYIIGISVRTTNINGQSGIDIPKLWHKFMSENILEKIPNKLDSSIYAVYTDYEGDFTKPYTTIIGCKVSSLDEIPQGMVGKSIPAGTFVKYTAKGDLTQGAVYHEWTKIWNSDLKRKYTADFEVYSQKEQNPKNAEVDIYISIE